MVICINEQPVTEATTDLYIFPGLFFCAFFFNLPEKKKIQLCLTHICEQSVIKNDKCNHIYPNQNMQSSFSNMINA